MRSLRDLWLETTLSLRREMDTLIANEKKAPDAAVLQLAAAASSNKAAAGSVAGAPSQAREGASANALGQVVSNAQAAVSCVRVRVRASARANRSAATLDRRAVE